MDALLITYMLDRRLIMIDFLSITLFIHFFIGGDKIFIQTKGILQGRLQRTSSFAANYSIKLRYSSLGVVHWVPRSNSTWWLHWLLGTYKNRMSLLGLIVDKEQLAAWLLAKEQIKASVIVYKSHTHTHTHISDTTKLHKTNQDQSEIISMPQIFSWIESGLLSIAFWDFWAMIWTF